jgi:WD40 repeat protein
MFILKDRKVSLEYVAFSPDGGTLAAAGMRGPLQFWDLAERRLVHQVAVPESIYVRAIFFSPDGRGLFALIDEEGLCLFDPSSGERISSPTIGEDAYAAAILADGRQVCLICANTGASPTASGSEEELRHFHLPGGEANWTAEIPGMLCGLTVMAFSPDGQLVAVGKAAGSVHLFDAVNGAYRGRCGPERSAEVRSVALSPDGSTVVWCAGSQLHLWRTAPLVEVAHHNLGKTHFFCVTFHPSSDFFATANGDGKVDYWNGRTGEHRQAFDWKVGKLHAVAFDATGDRAACCGKNGEIVVWDVDR